MAKMVRVGKMVESMGRVEMVVLIGMVEIVIEWTKHQERPKGPHKDGTMTRVWETGGVCGEDDVVLMC